MNEKTRKAAFKEIAMCVFISGTLLQSHSIAGTLKFKSDQNNVRLFEQPDLQSENLGKEILPPWNIEFHGSTPKLFVFQRQGYMPVYLPVFQEPKGEIEITIHLKKMDSESKSALSAPAAEIADELVNKIIEAQELIAQKKYQDALIVAEQLTASNPESAAVKLLLANAYLVNNQTSKANTLYANILADLPESRKATKESIERIQKKLNFETKRKPANHD